MTRSGVRSPSAPPNHTSVLGSGTLHSHLSGFAGRLLLPAGGKLLLRGLWRRSRPEVPWRPREPRHHSLERIIGTQSNPDGSFAGRFETQISLSLCGALLWFGIRQFINCQSIAIGQLTFWADCLHIPEPTAKGQVRCALNDPCLRRSCLIVQNADRIDRNVAHCRKCVGREDNVSGPSEVEPSEGYVHRLDPIDRSSDCPKHISYYRKALDIVTGSIGFDDDPSDQGATSDAIKMLPVIDRPPKEYWVPRSGVASCSLVNSMKLLSI